MDQKIPHLEYTKTEIETWGYVYDKLEWFIDNKFLKMYKDNFEKLKKETGMSRTRIPQLHELHDLL